MDAIIIQKNEFASLLRDSNKLYRLECGGVDNWVGYAESLYSEEDYDEIQNMPDDNLIDFYGYEAIEI